MGNGVSHEIAEGSFQSKNHQRNITLESETDLNDIIMVYCMIIIFFLSFFVLPMFNLLFQKGWLLISFLAFNGLCVCVQIELYHFHLNYFMRMFQVGHILNVKSDALTTCVVIGGVVGV